MQLARGHSATVKGYTVTYLGSRLERSAQKTTVKADVRIKGVGVYSPAISTYPNFPDGIGTPSVHTDLVHDVYLTLISIPPDGGAATIGVQVGTMVLWLWIGGAIIALGVAVALIPTRRRAVRLPPETSPADDVPASRLDAIIHPAMLHRG